MVHDVYTEALERRLFTLTYFLADNTVSVEENAAPNSGRAGFFRTFFARGKLPRRHEVGQIGGAGRENNNNNCNNSITDATQITTHTLV